MPAKGPIPKRSEVRRRTNAPAGGLTRVPVAAAVRVPAAAKGWHPIARDWYRSLKASGQSRYYDPSDWATAKWYAELMSRTLHSDEPNASLVSAIINGTRDLMTTEGQRRRLGVELTRSPVGKSPAALAEEEAAGRVGNVISLPGAGA